MDVLRQVGAKVPVDHVAQAVNVHPTSGNVRRDEDLDASATSKLAEGRLSFALRELRKSVEHGKPCRLRSVAMKLTALILLAKISTRRSRKEEEEEEEEEEDVILVVIGSSVSACAVVWPPAGRCCCLLLRRRRLLPDLLQQLHQSAWLLVLCTQADFLADAAWHDELLWLRT